MAQLQSISITGSLDLSSTTADTSSAGNLWFNTEINKLQYSNSSIEGFSTVTPL